MFLLVSDPDMKRPGRKKSLEKEITNKAASLNCVLTLFGVAGELALFSDSGSLALTKEIAEKIGEKIRHEMPSVKIGIIQGAWIKS